ncbi:MAG: fused MFS/spermidine synthase [Betaproteobacteria bacterium]|nr:fused MFS/spermidine synthase [Betaproteobacteria bacterium]
MILYAVTIFLSSFLLFLVQPIIAKQLLPMFGGSAGVWATCLLFFQGTLLAGYAYAHASSRWLSAMRRSVLHIGLAVLSLVSLPIAIAAGSVPIDGSDPILRILLVLGATIGLPYLLLSTTGPLVQHWFSQAYATARVYRLFALSNLASMAALLAYPFLIEPWMSTRVQAFAWSGFFVLFVALICWIAWINRHQELAGGNALAAEGAEAAPPPKIAFRTIFKWLTLSAMGSVMLLAVTNHLSQNISAVPLLWVLPLVIYLLTFVFCFDSDKVYRPKVFVLAMVAILGAMLYTTLERDLHHLLAWQVFLHLALLFFACMLCHGELAASRPDRRQLTAFYLAMSAGGAFGAFLIAIVAPTFLRAHFELEMAIVVLALICAAVRWSPRKSLRLGVGVVAVLVALTSFAVTLLRSSENVIAQERNFYGALRVKEYGPPLMKDRRRSMIHGTILHGDQYMDPPYERAATSYFKPSSGVGMLLMERKKQAGTRPLKVGIIGLGAGTLSVYGGPGDLYRYYEINPQVLDLATRYFTFIKNSYATVQVTLGDARLVLEREAPQKYDVLVIDAFSSDSIPVHLITREATAVYARHLAPDGVIAFHVSNRYLDLIPVVRGLADSAGLKWRWIHEATEEGSIVSDWFLMSPVESSLQGEKLDKSSKAIPAGQKRLLWTDDNNNLLSVLH